MRKVIVVLLVLALAGCVYWEDTYDPSFDIPATGAQSPAAVCLWVASRVRYLGDDIHDRIEYWQSPDQTYEWGRGDCEDYAILVMYLMRRDLGGWPEFVIGRYISSTTGGGHAWVLYDGRWYEPQTGADVTDNPDYQCEHTIEYGEVLWRSMNWHRAVTPGGGT